MGVVSGVSLFVARHESTGHPGKLTHAETAASRSPPGGAPFDVARGRRRVLLRLGFGILLDRLLVGLQLLGLDLLSPFHGRLHLGLHV